MKKTFVLCTGLLVLAFAFAAAVATAEAPAEVVTTSAELVTTPVQPGGVSGCAADTALDTASVPGLEWLASSSCCRPQCSISRDCDRICGKGLGSCVQVNSCCKQCICMVA